jgi:hypothetical protein
MPKRSCKCSPSPALALVLCLWLLLGPSIDVGRHAHVHRLRAEETPAVAVTRNAQYSETTYRSSMADCTVAWIIRDSEPYVVRQRARCAAPLEGQLPLMHAIGAAFFRQDPHAGAFRTLFWGRLAPDETRGGPQEMAYRLALAAFHSAGWDPERGKPKDGDINGFVRKLANEAMIYPELKALFARLERDITFSSAEKVLVMRADKLPFYDRLKQQGVRASDKLPFDCLTWFSVNKGVTH